MVPGSFLIRLFGDECRFRVGALDCQALLEILGHRTRCEIRSSASRLHQELGLYASSLRFFLDNMHARCGDVSESKSLYAESVFLKVEGTLRVPLARLGDSGRHTECACYFGCGLAALDSLAITSSQDARKFREPKTS